MVEEAALDALMGTGDSVIVPPARGIPIPRGIPFILLLRLFVIFIFAILEV